MSKIINCSLIIKDDFNNVLVVQRKVKRGQPKLWSILNREIKGKETIEKCFEKIAKDDLKGIVFNLEHFKDIAVNENETRSIYTGTIKETIVLHKDITTSSWVNLRMIDNYDFIESDKDVLLDFFSSIK